jgi:hypothetical protein
MLGRFDTWENRSAALPVANLGDHVTDRVVHEPGRVQVDVVSAVGVGDVLGGEVLSQQLLSREPIGERDAGVGVGWLEVRP